MNAENHNVNVLVSSDAMNLPNRTGYRVATRLLGYYS